MKEAEDIIRWLREKGSESNKKGMSRFGITVQNAFGVPMPVLRVKAKEYRRRHDVALALWETSVHEARIMAGLIADERLFAPDVMDRWVSELDSWDLCDQCCNNLFRKVPYVYDKIILYAVSDDEFVRRTAFVLIAVLAVHDKKMPDSGFERYLKLIEDHSADQRNFVRKAVNWALRQIGKRSMELNAKALEVAERLSRSDDHTARWIGGDAVRELTAAKTLAFIAAHR